MDLLLVDPPRSGLQPDGVARVLAAQPKRLLCVHCAADALARDLEGLCAGGWRVAEVRLCDMFPHTEHTEVLTLLTRNT
jgi:tRNA/tmRNA/rRNA uracil-C5-methylase (TrmA/RlmC/RlmD family)